MYDLNNLFNATSASSVYVWNQELVIVPLWIIAFCQVVFLLFHLAKWFIKIFGGNDENV